MKLIQHRGNYFEQLSEILDANNIASVINNGTNIIELLTRYQKEDLLKQFKEQAINYLSGLNEKISDDSFVEMLFKTTPEKKKNSKI